MAAMTFATGVIIANNYYAQPLEAAIAEAFHASSAAVGAVLTTIQLSYALGLALLVPLGDLLERRRLVVTMLDGDGARPGRGGAEPGVGRARLGGRGRRADERGRADPRAVRRAPRPRRRAGQDDLDGDVRPARRGAALPGGGGRGGRGAGLAGGVRARRRAHRRGARRAVAGAAGARTRRPGCATPRCCARCSPSCARSRCCAGGSSTARRRTPRSARCGRASGSCSPGRRTACPRA